MNILVTTVTVSTKKVEQLLLLVNNISAPFSMVPDEFYEFRKIHNLSSVDECWIITVNKHGFRELKNFCKTNMCRVKIFRCNLLSGLDTEEDLKTYKSLLYNVVLKARETSEKLYLSSVEGTMYGDMQEAARTFGCECFLHIKNTTNIPLMIQKELPSSLYLSTDNEICSGNFTFESKLDAKESEENFEIYDCTANYHLLNELEIRNKQAIHLYGNFYGMVKNPRKEREIFRKLYYLPQNVLDKLKEYKLGECKEKDLWIIQHLPKAELHSHIGGLLLPEELVEVSLKAKNYKPNLEKQSSVNFYDNIQKILKYQNNPKELEYEIYKNVKDNFKTLS